MSMVMVPHAPIAQPQSAIACLKLRANYPTFHNERDARFNFMILGKKGHGLDQNASSQQFCRVVLSRMRKPNFWENGGEEGIRTLETVTRLRP